jgi:hypothetical protein
MLPTVQLRRMPARGWSTAVQGCPSLLCLTLWWCPGCTAGKGLSNGSCQPCLAGTYSAQIGTAPCATCPSGSTSPAGASTCGEPPATHFNAQVVLSCSTVMMVKFAAVNSTSRQDWWFARAAVHKKNCSHASMYLAQRSTVRFASPVATLASRPPWLFCHQFSRHCASYGSRHVAECKLNMLPFHTVPFTFIQQDIEQCVHVSPCCNIACPSPAPHVSAAGSSVRIHYGVRLPCCWSPYADDVHAQPGVIEAWGYAVVCQIMLSSIWSSPLHNGRRNMSPGIWARFRYMRAVPGRLVLAWWDYLLHGLPTWPNFTGWLYIVCCLW